LFFTQSQSGRRIDVKSDAQCLANIDILNGNFPSQKDLRAIFVGWEIGRIKASAAAINDRVRLPCVEDHRSPPDQGDSMTCSGKMQVEPFVLGQKEVAKSSTTILRTIVVVLRAAASH